MVPSNEPVVVPLTGSNNRWAVKVPAAPANRPVPPVIVACSSIAKIGVLVSAVPVKFAVTVSPFAAVKVYVPSPVLVAKFTVCGISSVNRPRSVAVPLAETTENARGGSSGVVVCEPSKVPLKGTLAAAGVGETEAAWPAA
jgi:hypothetical protein